MNSNIADREKMSFLPQNSNRFDQKVGRFEANGKNPALKNPALSSEKSGFFSGSSFFSQFSSFQKNFLSHENVPFPLSFDRESSQNFIETKERDLRDFSRDYEKSWEKEEISPTAFKEKVEPKEEEQQISNSEQNDISETVQKKQKIEEEKLAGTQKEGDLLQEIRGLLAELDNLLRMSGGHSELLGKNVEDVDFGKEPMLQKANVLLKKFSQIGPDVVGMHKDLKEFLKNVVENGFNDFSKGQWKKSLGDLSARYQDHFIEKKVMHNPSISATVVEKENPEVFLGSLRKNTWKYGEDNQNTGKNDGVRDFSARATRTNQEKHTANIPNNAVSSFQQKNLSANPQLFNKTTFQPSSSFHRFLEKEGDSIPFGKDFGGWGDISPKNKSSFSASLSKTNLLDSQQREKIMQTIVGKIKQSYRGGQENFSLKLRPQELGSVDVFMRKENGKVTLRLTVESQAVKEAVESRLSDISQHLLQSDIELSSLDVCVGNGSENKNASDDFSSSFNGERASKNASERDEAVKHSQAQELSEAMNWSLGGSLQRFYA